MYKKLIYLIYAALFIAACLSSCSIEELELHGPAPAQDGLVEVSFSVSLPETKSAVIAPGDENRISSLTLFAYLAKGGDYTNNPTSTSGEGGHVAFPEISLRKKPEWNLSGHLVAEKTFPSHDDIRILLPVTKIGEAIHIYAVANLPWLRGPVLESELCNIVYRYPSALAIGPDIPMVMDSSFKYIETKEVEIRPGVFRKIISVENGFKPFKSVRTKASGIGKVSLELSKAVAKYRFRLDNRISEHMRASSIKLRQAPLVFTPFLRGYKALSPSDVGDGDYGTAGDVLLCEGGQVSFYCLENMQGYIEPSAPGGGLVLETGEWAKVPKYNPSKHDVCTYLELTGFMDGSLDGKVGNVVYRFYLGKDNESNYDIERNTSYDITMTATLEGLNRPVPSWRITDERTVFSEERNLYMAQKLTYSINVSDDISLSPSFEESLVNDGKVSIKAVKNHQGKVVGCEVSALSPGISCIYSKSGGLVKKVLELNVQPPLFKADKEEVPLFVDGSSGFFSLRYENAEGEELPKSIFDTELYKSLLEYDITASSERLTIERRAFLDMEECRAYVNSFGGATAASQLSGTVTVKPRSKYIAPVAVSLKVLEPFPVQVKTIDRPIHDRSLLDGGIHSEIIPMAINAPNVSVMLTRQGSLEQISTNMIFRYSPLEGLIRIWFDGSKKKTCGRLSAHFSVKNQYSGEYWENSTAKCNFIIVSHIKICGKVKIERGADGAKYACVQAESSRPDILSPSVPLGHIDSRQEGFLGGIIYRVRVDEDVSEQSFKERYFSGPDIAVINQLKTYPENRLRLPVVFDLDYMDKFGAYYAFSQGGWID